MFSVNQFRRDFPLKNIIELLKRISFLEFCNRLNRKYKLILLVDNVFNLCLIQLNDFELKQDQEFYHESCNTLGILFKNNLHLFRPYFISQVLNNLSKLQLNWLTSDELNQLLRNLVSDLETVKNFELAVKNIMYALGRFSDQGLLEDKCFITKFLNVLFFIFEKQENESNKLVLASNIRAVSGILYGFNRLYANGLILTDTVNIKFINSLIDDCAKYILRQINSGKLLDAIEATSDFLFNSSWITTVNHKIVFPEFLYHKILNNKALVFHKGYRMARVCASVVVASKSVPGFEHLHEDSLNFIKDLIRNQNVPPLIDFQEVYQKVCEKFEELPPSLKGDYIVTNRYCFIETVGLTLLKKVGCTPVIMFHLYRPSRFLKDKNRLTGKDEYINKCVRTCLEHLKLNTLVECVFLKVGALDVQEVEKVSDHIIRTILKIVSLQKESLNKASSMKFYHEKARFSTINTRKNLLNHWQ
jgi:hypothetical protein